MVEKRALELLDADIPTENGWPLLWNDAIEMATKQIRAQAKDFGIEISVFDVDHELIWAGIQRDRMWR